MLRTVCDQPTLWETILPAEVLELGGELAAVDALLTTRGSSSRSERISILGLVGRRSRSKRICG